LPTLRRRWVDYGPSSIPNADVRRNVCRPQTHQSQIGHEPPNNLVSHFSRKRSFTGFLLGPRDVAGNDEECAEQWAMRDEAHRDLGWRRGHTAKPVCPSESPSPKEVVRDSIDIARYDAQRRASER